MSQIDELKLALAARVDILMTSGHSEELREMALALSLPERENPGGYLADNNEPVVVTKEHKLDHVKSTWLAGMK